MTAAPEAVSVTLQTRRPLAPPFHRHIAKRKLMHQTYQVGDRVVIYDIIATQPEGVVQITENTQILFE